MSTGLPENGGGDIKRTFSSWLFRQEAQTVLLFVIVLGGGYGMYYAMDKAIPAHLGTIQTGYDRLQQQHEKSETRILETHEKTIDRISKDYQTHHEELVDMVREMNGTPSRREKTAAAKGD